MILLLLLLPLLASLFKIQDQPTHSSSPLLNQSLTEFNWPFQELMKSTSYLTTNLSLDVMPSRGRMFKATQLRQCLVQSCNQYSVVNVFFNNSMVEYFETPLDTRCCSSGQLQSSAYNFNTFTFSPSGQYVVNIVWYSNSAISSKINWSYTL